MIGYCDSDYAGSGHRGQMKSTSGYVIIYAGGPVHWCSRKQEIVATSTTEAEYISAAQCCKELQCLTSLVQELINIKPQTDLMVDNQSAIKLIKSGQMNRRSKHIDVRYYFISEVFDQGLFRLEYCPTNEQVADILTKPLQKQKFEGFRAALCHNKQIQTTKE